jgi:hypothetical protein
VGDILECEWKNARLVLLRTFVTVAGVLAAERAVVIVIRLFSS